MKHSFLKTTGFLLLLFLSLFIISCNEPEGRVLKGRTTEIPSYALSENATPLEMRETAVRAMHDELTIQWYPEKTFEYVKSGVATNERFQFFTEKNYCGLPYSNGESSLFHWLQYYDFEKGTLNSSINSRVGFELGNTCACSVMWGWLTVCPDIRWDATRNIFPENGAVPVKGYNYPEGISDYEKTSTNSICEANGKEQMFEAYGNAKMADLFMVFGSDNHVIMAIKDPIVRRRGDGSINGNTSFVTCQDQRFGSINPFYRQRIDNADFYFSGQTSFSVTFDQLYSWGMIPMTTAQFLGEKPYVKAAAQLVGDKKEGAANAASSGKFPETYEEFSKMHIESNYNIITVTIRISDEDDKKEIASQKYIRLCNYLFQTPDKNRDKQYELSYYLSNTTDGIALKPELVSGLQKGNTYMVKAETLLCNGETITVFNGPLEY